MEREFKWNIKQPEDFDVLADSDFVKPLVTEETRLEMEAAYYDTADGLVSKVHGGLRLRRENKETVVCLKLAARSEFDGACKAREEYEVCAEDIRAGIRRLPSVGAPQDFCDQLMQANLIEQGRTMFTRFASQLAYKGCTCELSFDYGRMTHLTRIGTICEMELEYKGGSDFDFDELAITLQNKFALEPQPLSKLARMMQL